MDNEKFIFIGGQRGGGKIFFLEQLLAAKRIQLKETEEDRDRWKSAALYYRDLYIKQNQEENIMNVTCGDNRFEIIQKAKEDLIKSTNIEMAKDEMAVLDNILFRAWQMGWLDKYEPDYKKRMKKEYWQLKDRYDKLHRMLVKYEAGTLDFTPTCSLELLKEQKAAMGNYLRCLEVRAEIEEIKL